MIDRAQTPHYSTPPSTSEPISITDPYSVNRNRHQSQTMRNLKAVAQHNNTTAYYQPSYGRNRPQRTIPPPGYTGRLEPNIHHVNPTPNPPGNKSIRKAQAETQNTVTTAYYQPSYGRNRPERTIPPPVHTTTASPTSARQLQMPKRAISSASNIITVGADMRPQVINAYYQPSYGRNRPERTIMPLTQGNNTGNIGLFSNALYTGTRPPARDGPLSIHSSPSKNLSPPVGFGLSPDSTDGSMRSRGVASRSEVEQSLESQITPTLSLIPISAQESIAVLTPTPLRTLNQTPARGRAQAVAPGLAINADPPAKLRAYKRVLAGVAGKFESKNTAEY